MEKLKLHSPDLTAVNIDRIAALFPNCITEAKDDNGNLKRAIDFDLLRQELSPVLVEGPQERYRLDWPGKREALAIANQPITKTLRPCREESVNFDATKNLYIEGDNLDALKLLQETYLGKVKMIYIDPPYNTGNDFIYDDDFTAEKESYNRGAGEKDQAGNRMMDEERWRQNTTSNGRFHSDWLKNIYSRLKLAKNLLREDGVILISIDDGEIANLRRLCDEIFGDANFVACLIWEKGRKNDARLFSLGHDYILVFARSREFLRLQNTKWREVKPGAVEIQSRFEALKATHGSNFQLIEDGLRTFFKSLAKTHPAKKLSRYNKVDENGVWRDDNMSWPGGGGPDYEIKHPTTGKPCEVPPGGWRYSTKEKMLEMISKGRVLFRDDHTEPPIKKTYLVSSSDDDDEESADDEAGIQVAGTYFYRSALQASNLMDEMFGVKVFDSPKDHEVIARWMNYVGVSERDIVADFYSGSATTAHAAFWLNLTDGIPRRWILVQLPEVIDPDRVTGTRAKQTAKNAVSVLSNLKLPATIAEIGKERIRRAGQKIKDEISRMKSAG